MRTLITKIASAVASISLFVLATGTAHAAGTATLSINGGTPQQGSVFTATIRETSSDPVVSVQADLAYDASKLECVGIDGSTSAFSISYQAACGGGYISIARATPGTTLTGTQTVAVVSFRALAGAGNTAINFGASSGIYRSPDAVNVWNGNTAGAGVTFQAQPTTAPTPAATPKPTAMQTAQPTTAASVMAATAEATPAPSASPTPMEGQATTEPTTVPAPTATDTTRAISNTTIGSILVVVAAGIAALYVVRRLRADK